MTPVTNHTKIRDNYNQCCRKKRGERVMILLYFQSRLYQTGPGGTIPVSPWFQNYWRLPSWVRASSRPATNADDSNVEPGSYTLLNVTKKGVSYKTDFLSGNTQNKATGSKTRRKRSAYHTGICLKTYLMSCHSLTLAVEQNVGNHSILRFF